MYHTGFKKNCDLIGKCDTCKNYKPLIKMDKRMGFKVQYCRGKCTITKCYKQRTETCKKYMEV